MKQGPARQKKGAISLLMVVSPILILAAFSLYDYVAERHRLEAFFSKLTDPVPKRMAISLKEPLWFLDKNIANYCIHLDMENRDIFAVVVREVDGKVFVAHQRDKDWNIIESDGNIPKDFRARSEIVTYEEHPAGSVEVYFTDQFIEKELGKLRVIIIVKIFLMSLCLVIVWRREKRTVKKGGIG